MNNAFDADHWNRQTHDSLTTLFPAASDVVGVFLVHTSFEVEG